MSRIETALNRLGLRKLLSKQDPAEYVRPNVRQNLTYYPDLNIVYYANAKSGSSTIRSTLWRAVDQKRGTATLKNNPRDHDNSPAQSIRHGSLEISGPDDILDAIHFSVVRHPLVRLVSGYLNKIRPSENNKTWHLFCNRYKVPRDVQLTFTEFLDRIADDTPYKVDKHFRPQSINILYGYVPLSHVGQLEDLRPTAGFLESHGVRSIEAFQPHATGAADYLKDYFADPAILKKAVAFLEADFENFNYAPNIGNVLPLGEITPARADTTLLREILVVEATPEKMREVAAARAERMAKSHESV